LLDKCLTDLELSSELWGINPEFLFLYLSEIYLKTDNLSKVLKLETIRTNVQKNEESCRHALKWFCEYLGLIEKDQISPLGKIILINQNPLKSVRACLFVRDKRIHTFFKDAIINDKRSIKRSEYESYFPGEASLYSKVLVSFLFVTPMRTKMKLNISLIRETGEIIEFPREVEAWLCAKSIYRSLLATKDEELLSELASETLNILDIPFQIYTKSIPLAEAIKHLGNIVSDTSGMILTNNEVLTKAVENILMHYIDTSRIIQSYFAQLLRKHNLPISKKTLDIKRFKHIAKSYGIKSIKIDTLSSFLIDSSRTMSQVYLLYLKKITDLDMKGLISFLSETLKENIEIDSYNLYFKSSYNNEVLIEESLQDYAEFLFQKYAKYMQRLEKLSNLKNYLNQTTSIFHDIVKKNMLRIEENFMKRALSKRISPFYYVFTILNPSDAGKEIISNYVGRNRLLKWEVEKLSNDWPDFKTDSSATYVDMADKLFSKGLEKDLPTKEIRIMTPYTDYEIQKYVSMLRRLIMKDYTIRIICRLSSDQKPWRRLKKSLLEGLGEKTRKVQIRTYTRFKEFLPASKLHKLDPSQRKEFGVHAKIFMIGDETNGAVLLWSANMLENSFNWNPESGVYTEDPIFIKSVKSFFDFLWNLSKHDALDFSKLDRISKGPFFPKSYYI